MLNKKTVQAHESLNKPVAKRLSIADRTPSVSVASMSEDENDDVFDENGLPPQRKRMSLLGVALSMRAFNITRRLSVSQYMSDSGSGLLSSSGSRKNSVYQPVVKMENTYRTEPAEDEKFPSSQVHRIISEVFDTNLSDQIYRTREASSLVTFLSTSLSNRVKMIDMPRYKIVVNVVLGQNCNQSLKMATRCLLDASLDNFACATFKNKSMFAIGIIHGVYCE